jgi:serine O-acetyltransferase
MATHSEDTQHADRRSAQEVPLLELLIEDFNTHDKELTSPGFWAVAAHHVGERIDRIEPALLRRPLGTLQSAFATAVDWVWGIQVPRQTKLGRRVHIWHFGSTLLNARSIGNDVHIRHDTTVGPVRSVDGKKLEALPIIEDSVDLGSGTCVMGGVTVGEGAVICANTVVLEAVPAGATVFGVPGRIIPG